MRPDTARLLGRGLIKRIHVNQHEIKANATDGGDRAVITVKTSEGNHYGHEVALLDDQGREVARVVYRPDDPLSCGARVWIETKLEVSIDFREEAGGATLAS
jgi:hypothetical protein